MAARIPVASPDLGEAEALAAAEAVRSGWVTQGPRVAALERDFAAAVGAPLACAVSNCTAALHLALLSVGVSPGDVVATVSHSFIATANAVRCCQAEPVFLDIDPATRNLDSAALARFFEADCREGEDGWYYRDAARLAALPQSPLRRIKPPLGRVAAVLAVHQVGMPADMGAILALAGARGIPVVEDAACAAGSLVRPAPDRDFEPVGRPHGAAACFSFHPRKVLTTGDGGMLTTAAPEHDRLFRLLRQHGMSVSDAVRHAAATVVFERYLVSGFNYRMTDIQAAVGREQVARLPEIVARRVRLARRYQDNLSDLPDLVVPREPAYGRSNWQSFVVALTDPGRRDQVMQRLLDRGVSTRRGVMCAHLEPPYADAWPKGCLPASEAASAADVVLPLFPAMGDDAVDAVCQALRESLA